VAAEKITHLSSDERKAQGADARGPNPLLKSPGLASGQGSAGPGRAAGGAEHHPRARPRAGPAWPE
jgi:hypothetical protein